MRQIAICWALGIVACQFLSDLPSLSWSFLSLHCVLLILNKNKYLKSVGWIGLGFLYAFWTAHSILNTDLPIDLEGKLIEIQGRIVDIPQNVGDGIRFEFELDSTPDYPSFKARLNWYKTFPQNLQTNQRYKLQVRLKKSHGFRNPNTFDQERWFFQNRIRAQGYIKTGELLEPISYSFFQIHLILKEKIENLRFQFYKNLKEKTKDLPRSGILIALILGEEKGVSHREWEIFRMTGTTHIVSVSGSHLTIMIFIIFYMMRKAIKIIGGKWLLKITLKDISIILSLIIVFIYAWLAGFSIPTQRSLIMICSLFLGILCYKDIIASQLLLFALALILFFDPLSSLSIGFWLSFGGISILIWIIDENPMLKKLGELISLKKKCLKTTDYILRKKYLETKDYIASSYKASLATFIALTPPLLLIFGQTPLLSIISNMITIGLFTFPVMPLLFISAVLSLFNLEYYPLLLSSYALDFIMKILEFLGSVDSSMLSFPNAPIWTLSLAMIGAFLVLMPKGIVGKWISIFLFLPALFPYVEKPKEGEIYFDLLDVGQGLSVVIQTKNHVLIYDTAPAYENRVIAESTLIPFLRGKGIQEISRLIISHPHADHAGGVKSLMQTFEINDILTTEPKRWENASYCKNGQFWEWDGVKFEMLAGEENYYYNNSCVLKITTGKHSILLTGDVEKDQEWYLSQKKIKANIVVAPHHGSKTSSNLAFINAVRPNYALFSVGYKNNFKHPSSEVIQRYQLVGAQTLETQNSGMISFQITPENISKPQRYREINRHYWHR